MRHDPDTLIHAMSELDALLVAEDEALRTFDVAVIATVAERKIELADLFIAATAELEHGTATWTAPQREQLATLHGHIGVRARANDRRMRASLRAVRDLVDHITGVPRGGYGRDRGAVATRPVLTSGVG